MASRESDWRREAENSILLKSVSHWREKPDRWFRGSYDRLPETVRVNPMSEEKDWVESWLSGVGANRIPWFSGPGSAWEMPFERGSAKEEVKILMAALHETGRITRQEAVSMLPVLALDPTPGQIILDLCASPGSKTTQICEHLGDSGAVVANEVISGRVNTLVTNVQRHASRTVLVVQHDGRHIPRVPGSGFDGVLVDVPCTGSGTTRKNPDVWGKWRPSSGRSLHSLQYDLLTRAIELTKPGGRVVYSTCSLDPIENEAVVARVLAGGKVRVVPRGDSLSGVPSNPGMTNWPLLNDKGELDNESKSEEYLIPTKDMAVSSQLNECLRVWNDEIGGGGFFLAVLERILEDDVSGVINPFMSQKTIDDPESFPQPIDDQRERELREVWGSVPSNMWSRGKSLLWSSDEIREIWSAERTRKSGRELIPGNRWRPLKVIHLGLIAARLRKGRLDRTVSRAARRLREEISGPFVNVDEHVINDILRGKEPLRTDVSSLQDTDRGSRILVGPSGYPLAVWVGSRVTPMVSQSEITVMRGVRDLSYETKEEE
ncbi:MAG: RsmB/NOP family class I SAM-dependent RNA methyltransferase [Candidatus Thalassarchaeaceae archaeon]|nr:RsmB/NOP family class I SAM-dependent RNA methyltransferase [Candidatus Thalassarchaeaceae archaeon]